MDMNSQTWKLLHDCLSRLLDPAEFGRALAWCEVWMDAELDPSTPPREAVQRAISAYRRARR